MNEGDFGVALTRCYFCCEPDKIVINSLLTRPIADRVREMHNKIVDMDPCQKCRDLMKERILLIGIDASKSPRDWNKEQLPCPFRTGDQAWMPDEMFKEFIVGEGAEKLRQFGLKHRWMFIEGEVLEKVGLTRRKDQVPVDGAPPREDGPG